jgi:SAM-dependent methyltransferase
MHKTPLRRFLAANPFPNPLTLGFFYREKMRAIHRVAPDEPFRRILEVGGGQSGLTSLLYPEAEVVNVDIDFRYSEAPCNKGRNVRFICADSTALPFAARSFDAVTMFDLLEHIPEDRLAVSEAFRVLAPNGYLILSYPNEHWRFPYYRALRRLCPTQEEIMAEWGHVRRGYSQAVIHDLTAASCLAHHTFITPVTVVSHDIAWSSLPGRYKRLLCALLGPLTWTAHALHRSAAVGTETASVWRKPSPAPAING